MFADCVTEKQLIGSFSQFGHVTHVHINRSQGKALVFFQQVSDIVFVIIGFASIKYRRGV